MRKYFIFFVVAWSIFLFHAIYTKHAIYGDGNGYYSYTQALFFDKSLNFEHVYGFLSHFQGRTGEFSRLFWDPRWNPYSIGTGIVWLPSMLLMSLFTNSRFSLIYELGPGLTGIICMLSGLYIIEKYLSRSYSKKTVFWTILTIFFGSNVLYYTAFEPALSHQPAFLIIALLLSLTAGNNKKINLFLIGLLSGLLVSIRIGDAILLIPVLFAIRNRGTKFVNFLLGFAIAYTPQLINQAIQYNGIFNNPYINGENGTFLVSLKTTFEMFFSIKRGLFIWTPLSALAIYGLIKEKKIIYLISLGIYWLLVSFWPGVLSAGFGIRLVFSATPYFAPGIAYVYEKINIKNISKSFAFFSSYNAFLLFGFYFLGWKNLP